MIPAQRRPSVICADCLTRITAPDADDLMDALMRHAAETGHGAFRYLPAPR